MLRLNIIMAERSHHSRGVMAASASADGSGDYGVIMSEAGGWYVVGEAFCDIRTKDEHAVQEARANARLWSKANRMYDLLHEGLTGQKADGTFTDDTWLTRVRDLLEDEIDIDEESEHG